MEQYRKLTFGKYKGDYVLHIITTHIGWIMWALNNIDWFKLNDIEQKLYDAIAIHALKYNIDYVFPRENLIPFIKDKEALNNLETPITKDFRIKRDNVLFQAMKDTNCIVAKSNASNCKMIDEQQWIDAMRAMAHSAVKEWDFMDDEERSDMEKYGILPPLPMF
jgi:hypothetical protein